MRILRKIKKELKEPHAVQQVNTFCRIVVFANVPMILPVDMCEHCLEACEKPLEESRINIINMFF